MTVNMQSLKQCFGILGVAMIVVLAAGCANTTEDGFDSTFNDPLPPLSDTSEALPDVDVDKLFYGPTRLKVVYFGYDRFDLTAEAMDTLRENADKIKQVTNVSIQIEGHCDERGTQGYNLALGEKRALSTRAHLINLGVDGNRLTTISYGKEEPADPGHTEAAWAKNRRCEFSKAQQ